MPVRKKTNILRNTLCLKYLLELMLQDNIKIVGVNEKFFSSISVPKSILNIKNTDVIESSCAFSAVYGSHRLLFCFAHQGNTVIKKLSKQVLERNKEKNKSVLIIIFSKKKDVEKARIVSNASRYKGCFFTSIEEIMERVGDFSINDNGEGRQHSENRNIRSFKVMVKENIPMKGETIYKLRFASEELKNIAPGQFIMIDTKPLGNKKSTGNYIIHDNADSSELSILDSKRKSFLKRPFGIHRAYHRYFSSDYLKNLFLPPVLSPILYTVLPDEFDVLYRVLTNGAGTNELKNLKKGDVINVTGPLGKVFKLRDKLRKSKEFINASEVHLIGGGAGIAPLVYMAQALCFFNKRIKVFIGIQKLSPFSYYSESFSGEPLNAMVYYKDLVNIGIPKQDIYISTEVKEKNITHENYSSGFISTPYKKYLKESKNKKAVAITCGPDPMMCEIKKISAGANVPLFVLMEKRMACGTGVCFSCVCKKSDNNYSRVCIDGPVYNADEINFDNE